MTNENEAMDGTFLCTSQENDLIDIKARKEGGEITISIQENNEALYINLTEGQARALTEWLMKATQIGDSV